MNALRIPAIFLLLILISAILDTAGILWLLFVPAIIGVVYLVLTDKNGASIDAFFAAGVGISFIVAGVILCLQFLKSLIS